MTTTTPLPRGSEFPRTDRFRPRGTVHPGKRGRVRAVVLLAVHLLVLGHILYWLESGEAISPIEPSEAGETFGRGLVNAGFILLGLAIVSTLVLGRWFCGWACHFVAYQDGCSWLLKKFGFKPSPLRSRLLVLVPLWVAFDIFFKEATFRWFEDTPQPNWQFAVTKIDFWETFPGLWMTLLTIAVGGFLMVYWLGAKGFCTYGCPYGALFGIADRFSPMRIQVTDDCEHCGHCTSVCTSGVQVHKEVAQFGSVVDPGCMKCMDCVSTCPNDALYFGAGKPPFFSKSVKHRADLSWGEEILGVVVFAASVLALRGLYGRVPFLLSVGCSVLLAALSIVVWRALRSSEFGVQGRAWKRDGKFTTHGRLAVLASLVIFAGTAHSGFVRYHTVQGLSTWEEVNEDAIRTASTNEEFQKVFEDRRADLDRAAEHLQTSIRYGLLGNAPALRDLGTLKASLGELDESLELLRRAVEAEEHWSTRVALANTLSRRGDVAGVERVLREGLEHDPARPQLAVALANLLGRQQRFQELIDFGVPAFERRPSIDLGMVLAFAQSQAKQQTQAIATLGEVERLFEKQESPQPGPNLAQAYVQLNQVESAKRVANRTKEFFDRAPQLEFGLGLAALLAQLAEIDSSRAVLLELQKLAPEDARISDFLQQLDGQQSPR